MSDITTLFVAGFPEDVSEREMLNFCRFCRGFEFAIARHRSNEVFVKFETIRAAEAAMHQINGAVFDVVDLRQESEIRASFAKREASRPDQGYFALSSRTEDRSGRQSRKLPDPPWERHKRRRLEPKPPSEPPEDEFIDNEVEEAYESWDEEEAEERPHRKRRNEAPPERRGSSSTYADTLACRIQSARSTEKAERYFRRLEGFVKCLYQSRAAVLFVKFKSEALLEFAVESALDEGYEVDIARRNLDD
eukprot:TRINITY_DN109233_c0_g1_i1.p1 TRINITY_DN109233_c0_g1~~TRINITY_DN109233_c0_g1_i1.p1  ORF type:complete len:249 (-),score=29.83 TRINITY_DN109233_c0_g1_i1:110-856(-)